MAGVGAVIENGQVVNQTTPEAKAKAESKDTVQQYKDQFLQLLVAQMKHQDPMEPTSNTEYISQYATFSSVEQMQNMSQTMEISRASDMVGKYVVVRTEEGNDGNYKEVEGRVDYVTIENNKAKVNVNGTAYDVDKVYSVISEDYEKASTEASTFAALMDEMPTLSQLTLRDEEKVSAMQQTLQGYNDVTKNMIPNSYITALEQYVAKIAALHNLQSQTAAVENNTEEVVDETQATQAGASSTDAAKDNGGMSAAAGEDTASTDAGDRTFESYANEQASGEA